MTLAITVLPRSSKSEVTGIHDGLLKVRLSSPPVDGKANDECVKLFSKLFKVPKTDISIIKGDRSKRKKVKISGANADSIKRVIEQYV